MNQLAYEACGSADLLKQGNFLIANVSDEAMDLQDRDSAKTRRFALIGMPGGFICSIADYLLEYIGALPNQTVGAYGVIEAA